MTRPGGSWGLQVNTVPSTDTGDQSPPDATDATPVVSVRDVCYEVGGQTILQHISFDVQRGEVFGVMGMSGSGKTTLIRLLIGLMRPTCGEIVIHGEDITELGEDGLNRVRSRMGMCFQYAALFDSLTVAQNVSFALRNRRDLTQQEIEARVARLLDLVDMAGIQDRMPADLSGGMKKRIGIARALIEHPDLMLYDEPTSGLDPVMAGIITTLIEQVRDEFGSTAVVVSHDVSSLFSIADRVLMLEDQRVVTIGTPEQMRNSEMPVIRQFVRGEAVGPLTEALAPR